MAGGKLENLLNELDSAENADKQQKAFASLKAAISEEFLPFMALAKVLRKNGIQNPAETLKNVWQLALQYEKSHPELANDFRQANALLQEASSEFLAKINLSFDQVMDRVSARYTSTTRVVTFISAVLVACALQLDTIYVMNRLSMDDALRDSFVEEAVKIGKDQAVADAMAKINVAEESLKNAIDAQNKVNSLPENNVNADDAQKKAEEAKDKAKTDVAAAREAASSHKKEYMAFLANEGLINFPTKKDSQKWWDKWCNNWTNVSIPGVFISIILLSFGAPFWYNTLGEFLRLRSLLAQKDDEQRNTRQVSQTVGIASPQNPDSSISPNPLQGERGDLNAAG